ncbi:MAG: hypothetical protein IK095_08845, partial [Oscillospiraceae bacterium]|nr:hypothetical protein [Oscillospiraceae bacterium]
LQEEHVPGAVQARRRLSALFRDGQATWPAPSRRTCPVADPFDQPGVEAYKKNMFRELSKPGAV